MTFEELESKVSEQGSEIEELKDIINGIKPLLEQHTHGGIETSGVLEPRILRVETFSPASISVGNGASGQFNSDNNAKTITVVDGIITTITTN